MVNGINERINTLTEYRRDRVPNWLYPTLENKSEDAVDYYAPKFNSFVQQYQQMRTNQMVTDAVYTPKEIYAAYNNDLMSSCKARASSLGWVIASIMGPIPPALFFTLLASQSTH